MVNKQLIRLLIPGSLRNLC